VQVGASSIEIQRETRGAVLAEASGMKRHALGWVAMFLLGCSDADGGALADAGAAEPDAAPPVADAAVADHAPGPDAASLTMTQVTFTPIASSDPDLVTSGRGAETWNGVDPGTIDLPVANSPAKSLDYYYRFNWRDIEDATQSGYDWTKFDHSINTAIDEGKSYGFGVMPVCDGCSPSYSDGHQLAYPAWLHTKMQSETPKDWLSSDGAWIPNWNSNSFLTAWENLLNAIAAHIKTGTHSGKNYADAIEYVDIRGYGNYGEWHTYPWTSEIPNGTGATSATLIRIIDSHSKAFPNYPLVTLIAAFSPSSTPSDVTYHALTATNTWGGFGWRRDNWGDPGYSSILENNPGSYQSTQFKTLIMDKWKVGPIVGEPLNYSPSVNNGTCDFYDFVNQVTKYHATSFGNGNIPNPNSTCAQDNVRAASKATGYRIILASGALTQTVGADRALGVELAWQNIGLAPPYHAWNVTYELHDASNTVVWSDVSTVALKLFLPATSATSVTDTFTLPSSIKPGAYTLHVVVRDPSGYRQSMSLAIQGRGTDGSYTIGNVTIQ
jgi:hypothetical protein